MPSALRGRSGSAAERYASASQRLRSSASTVTWSTDAGALPSAASDFIFSRRTAVSTLACRSSSRSVAGSARPPMSSLSAGRSASALPSVSMRFFASAAIDALPGANESVDSSSLLPNEDAKSANGAVIALVIRLTIMRPMRSPTENCGSSSDPEIGSWMSITPCRSLSKAAARSTGSFVAVGLSTRSPNVSWSSTSRFSAVSLRFSTR